MFIARATTGRLKKPSVETQHAASPAEDAHSFLLLRRRPILHDRQNVHRRSKQRRSMLRACPNYLLQLIAAMLISSGHNFVPLYTILISVILSEAKDLR